MLCLCKPMLFIGQQQYNTECYYFNDLLRKIFSFQKIIRKQWVINHDKNKNNLSKSKNIDHIYEALQKTALPLKLKIIHPINYYKIITLSDSIHKIH